MNGRCVIDGASGVSDSHVAIVVKVAGSMVANFVISTLMSSIPLSLRDWTIETNDLCAHIGCTQMPCDHVVLKGDKLTLDHMSFYSPFFPFPSQRWFASQGRTWPSLNKGCSTFTVYHDLISNHDDKGY